MLQIRKSFSSAPVRILYQGMVMCRLASTGCGSVTCIVRDVLSL
jgi:hypothetical protein